MNKARSEELLIVQTVSTDKHSFVVSKGLKDGISKGQEIIFANENVSLVCKAVEVSRFYSLWIPVDKNSNVPFKKEDVISYNSHAYGNIALNIPTDMKSLAPIEDTHSDIKKFRNENSFSLKLSLDKGLSQSSSDVSTDKNSTRSGYAALIEYNYRFKPQFETSLGLRMDNEVYRINNPVLDIPTTRIIGTIGATYHFIQFSTDKNNFYLTVAAGIGSSKTTVDQHESSGYVTLLPEARIGYLMPFTQSMAMIFEGSIESLSAHEKFSDSTEQVTNILNLKLTVGLRF